MTAAILDLFDALIGAWVILLIGFCVFLLIAKWRGQR